MQKRLKELAFAGGCVLLLENGEGSPGHSGGFLAQDASWRCPP